MAQRWRYQRNGQEFGPVTTADLRLLADSERLQPTDLVRQEHLAKWVPAGSVKGLFYTGRGPDRGSGKWGATVLVVVALVLLLAAGGAALVYSLHGFGGNTPPSGNPPPGDPPLVVTDPSGDPPPIGDSPTPDPDPPPADLSGGGSVPGDRTERNHWRSGRGTFDYLGGNRWEEKYDQATFNYVEKNRTPRFVELFDRSRDLTVRLHADHYEIKVRGKFERRLDGKWQTP